MSAKLRQFMSKKLVSECITMISSPGMVIHSPNNYVQCFCLHVSMQPRVRKHVSATWRSLSIIVNNEEGLQICS
jgi:hypothetical protein